MDIVATDIAFAISRPPNSLFVDGSLLRRRRFIITSKTCEDIRSMTVHLSDGCLTCQSTTQITEMPTSCVSSSHVVTPSSDASLADSPHGEELIITLVLTLKNFGFSFPVPEDLYHLASETRDQFLQHINNPTVVVDSFVLQESLLELITDFLDFNAKLIPNWAGTERASRQKLLRVLLDHLEREFLTDGIHTIAARSSDNPERLAKIIRSYYSACDASCRPISLRGSALLSSVSYGYSKLYAVLGGQGITTEYVEELREIHTIYNSYLADYIDTLGEALKSLASHPDVRQFYPDGLDITKWLQYPETTPEVGYLTASPVSFPIIGILQLAHYMVSLKVLGQSPSTFLSHLSGIAGHSQGVVVAIAIAGSNSWSSFIDLSHTAVKILFWIGVIGQQVCSESSPDPKIVSDSVSNDEGIPSPMLSIRGASEAQIQEHIDASNKYLPEDRKISIALANGPQNFVIAGPATSLCGLNARLKQFKVSPEVDQTRIPFKDRKLTLTNHFLPISAPFHSKYLLPAIAILRQRLSHIFLSSNSLHIPVYDTNTGEDLSSLNDENILHRLVYMITVAPVHWLKASAFESATHILDFGPGSSSGIGVVTSHNKQGTGVRVILASALVGKSPQVGYKSELFSSNRDSVVQCKSWARSYCPTLIRTADGQIHIDTRLSRLLHMPPIMVAGMTPTTASWRFVSATINAGYHIELAGGGYNDETTMTAALKNIVSSIPPGRGVNINTIYVNARAIAWQIPLLEKLRAEGVPIDGLTIGAGVPSIEIAQRYINDLGLKHIAFKPSSIRTIKLVIDIAKANPTFPIILQWTGGRAGGHHSFEDFHTPILEVYGRIRDCENIILVAGSGFGSAEDLYPYLTGAWSKTYSYPPMPFDGALFGSRMMTAKEASTSLEAKKKIVEAKGLDDSQWEKTYKGVAGGIITVISEMGEPIHVLATRGMRFWAEMDSIFRMGKDQKVAELEKKSSYIIKRLNEDFQKVWFGKNTAGEAVLLKEMTYREVLLRMIELMYISARGVWIDKSLQILTGDFIRRVEERFVKSIDSRSILPDYADLDAPQVVLDTLVESYPEIQDHIIAPLDIQFFLSLCLRPGKKPVPFVPVLDEHFEFYFKKDSLWQSENLWAVVGNDVGRTQILQGPVAAKHTKTYDEPVRDILDCIKNDLVSSLLKDSYGGEIRTLPVQETLVETTPEAHWPASEDGVSIIESPESVVYTISSTHDDLPSPSSWFRMIAGDQYTWRYALFTSESVISGTKRLQNPIRRICTPSSGLRVIVDSHNEPLKTNITIRIASDSEDTGAIVKARLQGKQNIVVDCIFNATPTRTPSTLRLTFSYHPDADYGPIREISDGFLDSISDFYRSIWFGDEQLDFDAPLTDDFLGGTMTITREAIASFLQATGSSCETYLSCPDQTLYAPLDFGIVIAWKALLKPIFLRAIGGNILKLVHLSNRFKRMKGTCPMRASDKVATYSRIAAVLIQDAGKVVEVHAVITKDEIPVMEVVSQFLYRGKYSDFETTFERKVEAPMQVHLNSRRDVEILKSKPWFQLTSPDSVLLDRTFIFHLETTTRFKTADTFSTVLVTGTVFEKQARGGEYPVASINYTAELSSSNLILRYLKTHGSEVEGQVSLDKAISIHCGGGIALKRPKSSTYAKASGDFNPIHVSNAFALLANLPRTIVHGMHTSSAIGSLLETWIAKGHIGAVRSFAASFVGMVLPDDLIEVELWHTAMINGRKVIKIIAKKTDSGEVVLKGEAEVEQQRAAYLFTGQGSQEQNMGMDLYARSPIARSVWERADKYYSSTYGFEITKIVRDNPKELTVHFGGVNGRRIRQNYILMALQTTDDHGQPKSERVFKDINEDTESYTYRSPKGLLFATQFTQAALTLMELARYKDMETRGLIPDNCNFAGHSLGEFPALAAFAQIMSIEQLVAIVFFRGMAMQVTVKRDEQGFSGYSMCAVNPSRISNLFDERMLCFIIKTIVEETGKLLEIVNFNISNRQYVCAGELLALDCLTEILHYIATQKPNLEWINRPGSGADDETRFLSTIRSITQKTQAKQTVIELKRGTGIIPLEGIDVPFHSTFLRPGVASFREFLASEIDRSNIDDATRRAPLQEVDPNSPLRTRSGRKRAAPTRLEPSRPATRPRIDPNLPDEQREALRTARAAKIATERRERAQVRRETEARDAIDRPPAFISRFDPSQGTYTLGELHHEYEFYQALHFIDEQVLPHKQFPACYVRGDGQLDPLRPVPTTLRTLFTDDSPRAQSGADRRRENLPTGNEVTAILTDEFDGASRRDIVLTVRNPREREPTLAPITDSTTRYSYDKTVNHGPGPVLSNASSTGTAYTPVAESSRLSFTPAIRKNQDKVRADVYKGLYDHLVATDVDLRELGRKVVLPSSFTADAGYAVPNGRAYRRGHLYRAPPYVVGRRPSSDRYGSDGLRTKNFSKRFSPVTVVYEDGYPKYRRRDNGDIFTERRQRLEGVTIGRIYHYNPVSAAYIARGLAEDDHEWYHYFNKAILFTLRLDRSRPCGSESIVRQDDQAISRRIADDMRSRLNVDQEACFQTITQRVTDDPQTAHFYLQGPGGTGKTFLYQTLYHYFRSQGKRVLCVASTGIAALLLPNGQTSHSQFKIPINLNETSVSSISKSSLLAVELRKVDLIIWDEVPMQHKYCFEVVHRLFVDLRSVSDELLFGGVPFLLGGDFAQILPVVPQGLRAEIVKACLQRSFVWPRLDRLYLRTNMRVRNATSPQDQAFIQWISSLSFTPELCGPIELPAYISQTQDVLDLIRKIYPPEILSRSVTDPTTFKGRVILSALNQSVTELNHIILSSFPGPLQTFHSIDSTDLDEGGGCGGTARRALTKYRSTFSPSVKANAERGDFDGQLRTIPRIRLSSGEKDLTFTLTRKQFPFGRKYYKIYLTSGLRIYQEFTDEIRPLSSSSSSPPPPPPPPLLLLPPPPHSLAYPKISSLLPLTLRLPRYKA
ncbi:hypothetical protein G7Y89_g486 [Cudoniella acicularis]|uniref:ATP-dependent DNA helicase n=1 Tax=Cudoniella acicularis TaxID=354080 RepID=A0A8H4RX34_9HELO|nr:hypothetical protein G7Y89_g486 [Cudoniella acicularis]